MKKNIVIIFFVIIVFIVWFLWYANKQIQINWDIIVNKWDWIKTVIKQFSNLDRYSFNSYILLWNNTPEIIYPWVYNFSGTYTKQEFFEQLEKWPDTKNTMLTIIEWRSIYDIDYFLTKSWYIQKNEYINYIWQKDILSKYKEKYEFLEIAWDIQNLEWFLYPDTYKIDVSKDIVKQLVENQITTFEKKIWKPKKEKILWFNEKLKNRWFWIEMDLYEIIILSSIIEKEENIQENKPIIAGIFFNRLQNSRRLDADITLCYWLEKPYHMCNTPTIIQNLNDSSNSYNTRQLDWMTPTPISNPSKTTITSLLNFENNDYFFYLHDNYWQIHPSENIQNHNIKKSKYINN